ncbi:phage portal protein [Phascolarctobacterium faecium]|jgi:HK97 family phage portal protein|uniref:phage portal protein n=1 Tax=Phascolarctobacterium faecium TaxID=33025 RepID=UPI003994EAEC
MSDTIRSPAGLLVGAFKNLFAPGAAKSATVSSQFRLTPGMMLNGVQLNNVTAMQYSAVWACIHVLAETFASCKCYLYQKLPDGSRRRAVENPLYDVLTYVAAPNMPAYYLRETMQYHVLSGGNAYAEKVLDSKGEVAQLNMLLPVNVLPAQDYNTGEIYYNVNDRGKLYKLPAEKILHIPGLGYNGVIGYSPLAMARRAIILGMSSEELGNKFFENGALATGVLETDKPLKEDAWQRLKEQFRARYEGRSNAGSTMILEGGMKFNRISVNPEEAQFLETRKYQTEEIARFYRVPLHLIQNLEKSTYSNIEQQTIDFYQNTMLPWFVRWEQFMNMRCLTRRQRQDGYYCEFDMLSMLRGDNQSRANMLHLMRQDGIINADEWRERENMNPLPDGQGKTVFINGNMLPVEEAAKKKGANKK